MPVYPGFEKDSAGQCYLIGNIMCFICFVCLICLWAGYWAFSRQGERKNPFKGRWRSGLQALKYRAEQRPGRREKDCAKQQFYAVFVFCCKKRGITTVGCVRQRKEGMVKPSLLIFNQRFCAGECGYVCGFAPRNPAPGRAPQGG